MTYTQELCRGEQFAWNTWGIMVKGICPVIYMIITLKHSILEFRKYIGSFNIHNNLCSKYYFMMSIFQMKKQIYLANKW